MDISGIVVEVNTNLLLGANLLLGQYLIAPGTCLQQSRLNARRNSSPKGLCSTSRDASAALNGSISCLD
jgi:hypothetical protein